MGDAQQGPDHVAVPVEIALFDAVIRYLVGDQPFQVFEVVLEIVRMGYVPERFRQQLRLRITDTLAERPVHLEQTPVEGDEGHADRRGFEGAPEPALASPARRLPPFFAP